MSTFALMAGGTGGHLSPAQSLAEELTRRGHRVELITDRRAAHLGASFPPARVHVVPAATPVLRRPLQALAAAWTIVRGIVVAWGVIGRMAPDVAVGFGGYSSFPPFVAARLRGVPGLLHEQNAVLGRANRALARVASALALSFEPTRYADRFGLEKTVSGIPVRDRVQALAGAPYPAFGDDLKLRLLVFGGSQGARFLSAAVPAAVRRLSADLRGRLAITQQCRPEDLDEVAKSYADARVDVELATFFDDLPERIAGSHLVVSRSGASTVAELAAIGRPAILVPLPGALDQDQRANAEILVAAGGAVRLDQATISPQSLASELSALLAEPEILARMASRALNVGRADAVRLLADLAERLARPAKGEPS